MTLALTVAAIVLVALLAGVALPRAIRRHEERAIVEWLQAEALWEWRLWEWLEAERRWRRYGELTAAARSITASMKLFGDAFTEAVQTISDTWSVVFEAFTPTA